MSQPQSSLGSNQIDSNPEGTENKNMLMDLFSALSIEKDQHSEADLSSHNFQQAPKFDKVLDNVEDIEDILEYAQEIFEVKNETTQRQTCNALLHYFYLPVVCGALTRYDSEQVYINEQYQISANTALFVLNKTVEMINFHPLINSIFMALFVGQGPQRIINQQFQCQYGQLAETLIRGGPSAAGHES